MTINNLASYLDFGMHQANTTEQDIHNVCNKVLEYQFHAAFVNPYYVTLTKKLLGDKAKVGTVISFPLGQETMTTKIASTQEAIKNGADALDIVLNVAFLKEHAWEKSLDEMQTLVGAAREIREDVIVKFIPETGFLTPDEIKKAAELMVQAGADYFKTCSGFGPRGATIEDVKLVRQAVGDQIKIKVAGGIVDYDQAIAFIQAGANAIGTSRAVEIITKQKGLAMPSRQSE